MCYYIYDFKPGGDKMFESIDCENCMHYEYDEDYESYVCSVYMDEDDVARYAQQKNKRCPFFRAGDEYQIVKKQM